MSLTQEIQQMIIDVLVLEDLTLDDIEPSAPLFGDGDGLGLDSIDALELRLALPQRSNIPLTAEAHETKSHFYSVNSLVALVESQGQR